MDADWSVELGPEDETLDFPWYASEELRWRDLKNAPEVLAFLAEVGQFPELLPALAALNASTLPLQTAKCDVWFEDQLEPAEDVYDSSCRLSSYVDVLFTDERRFSFESHETLVKGAVRCFSLTSEVPAAVELVIRRCYFRQDSAETSSGAAAGNFTDMPIGFYVSVYTSGYGCTYEEARSRWACALKESVKAIQCSVTSLR